jgi:hypothetical protein
LNSPYGRLGITPDPNLGLEIRGRAVRRDDPLVIVREAPAALDVALVLLAPLSQPPVRYLGIGAADSNFNVLPVYNEDEDGGLLIFGVLVISETGFALGRPTSTVMVDLAGRAGCGLDESENGSGLRVPARLRLATAAAAAFASSLSGAAALLFLDLLGVKPVLAVGPSRRVLRKRAGVVLRTGIAGRCSSGLGSKSSGNRRLRLELVCAGGVASGRG